MAKYTRTVLKPFNKALLAEQLTGFNLVRFDLAGFQRASEFVGEPTTEPKRVLRKRLTNGSYIEDFAEPGEIRFESAADPGGALDAVLSAHDSTGLTAEQARLNKDGTDFDTLIAQYPNIDGMNAAQVRNYVKLLARIVIRDQRDTAI